MRLVVLGMILVVLSSPATPAIGFDGTHGGDPLPILPADLELPIATPACAQPGERAFRVVYALPPSTLDHYDARVPLIRAGLAAATGVVLASSAPYGVDVRLRFVCDGAGEVLIEKARVPTPVLASSFSTIVRDLRALGFDSSVEKYWVLYEGWSPACGGCAGQGNVWGDDRPGPENFNNRGGMYAITYLAAFGPQAHVATLTNVMLHEAGHTMGAVQLSAPHTSGAWHCNDGADVMCYADGGPASAYTPLACPRLVLLHYGPEMPFDCGHDDYFHPAPAPGSYLATRWNLASASNLYVARSTLGST